MGVSQETRTKEIDGKLIKFQIVRACLIAPH
jgi:hypothetical protein